MNFETIIGIEIHCELKTKTKMFSGAPTSFAQLPNSCVNEIDLAHPGTLPCVNREAVRSALKAVMALHCEIDSLVKFDRKNYYYSDLPKGYQITQQFHPLGSAGYVDIDTEAGPKRIRINRLHMEEDTAKQFHYPEGTMIDYNRAGTPLIEIVSEPDLRSGAEAMAFVEKIRNLLFYLGVSDVKMEEGSMRCDVNISLRPYGYDGYGTKTEIKNLNSISNVQKAIDAEVIRQSKLYLEGKSVVQATRRYDEASRDTVLMRKKEGDVDYKFFPEPNILPIRLDAQWIAEIRDYLPELPDERKQRYHDQLGLSDYDVNVLVQSKELSDYYDEVLKHTVHAKLSANWVITELLSTMSKNNWNFKTLPILSNHFADLINSIATQEISGKQAKLVFEEMATGKAPLDIIEEKGMKQVSDHSFILKIIEEVLDEQPQSIEDYINGKDRAVGFLVGQVMKKSKGQANPALSNKMVVEQLNKRVGK